MTDPTETGARDLAQRIRDALAVYSARYGATVDLNAGGIDRCTFLVAPATNLMDYVALLRDALARIEADAATIATLEEERDAAQAAYDALEKQAHALRNKGVNGAA